MKTVRIDDTLFFRWVSWDHPANDDRTIPTKDSFDRFRTIIKPGDLVIDIGAWTGDSTITFGLLAGTSGKVIAFEPNPHTYRVLRANAAVNSDLCNIEAHNCAIMPVAGTYKFHYSDPDFCNGGYADGLQCPTGTGVVKHVHALDVVAKQLETFLTDGQRVSFIKIDTEGFDHHVIGGISELIERDHPVIMAEVFTDLTAQERADFMETILSIGYTIDHQPPRLECFHSGKAFDLIFYPR